MLLLLILFITDNATMQHIILINYILFPLEASIKPFYMRFLTRWWIILFVTPFQHACIIKEYHGWHVSNSQGFEMQ